MIIRQIYSEIECGHILHSQCHLNLNMLVETKNSSLTLLFDCWNILKNIVKLLNKVIKTGL